MSEQSKTQYGGDYIKDLSEAISMYTKQESLKQPELWNYGGANLQFAVERGLHFGLIEDKQLYALYGDIRQRNLQKSYCFSSSLKKELAKIFCEKYKAKPSITINFKAKLKESIKAFVLGHKVLLKAFIYWKSKQRAHVFTRSQPKVDLLIYIKQEKFIRYLAPILQKLDLSYAFLRDSYYQAFEFADNMPVVSTRPCNPDSRLLHLDMEMLACLYQELYNCLQQSQPKCVLVVEGNAPQDEIMNQVCQKLNIPCLCLQQGWASFVHVGFRNMSYSTMLKWGEVFANKLEPYNPRQKFVMVGNHILAEPVVLSQTRKAIAFFLQGMVRTIPLYYWEAMLKLVVLTAKTFPDRKIIVREHPSFPLSDQEKQLFNAYQNIQFYPPKMYGLAQVLDESCLALSYNSSTIYESIAAGVLPVIIDIPGGITCSPSPAEKGMAVHVQSEQAALDEIKQLLDHDDYYQGFHAAMIQNRSQYFSAYAETAVLNIIQAIHSAMS
ncbi:MAG: hypothetical protein K0Q57_46 [Gammaproteobacteria bacterium]|jgi:hypothetical protein|nr:hypothetical protein [Gammaproteobacteria bacterium]